MKILLVNKFHYYKGGSETYYFDLAKLLEKNGHEVAFFSMKDEKNIKTHNKEYFVEPIDLNSNNKLKALDVIYSKNNKRKMEEALEEFKPDIVHLNNFQRQLSASIIKPIIKRKIPIIFTAHDVQAICPAITMLDGNKNICEKCKKGKYINCIKNKCVKKSMAKSVLGAIEGWFYRKNKIYTNKINHIITPSEFYKTKFIEDGTNADKISVLHNFLDIEQFDVQTQDNDYALYFGRLSKEKGILNLINAFAKTDEGNLYIAGDGEEKENIESIIKEKNLQDRVKLLGYLDKDKMKEAIKNCKFVVVPSTWYENCPYSIMETLAIGKPVIGANIGGIPELIVQNETGLLYKYDDVEDLADEMNKLYKNKELVQNMGKNAKKYAADNYSADNYYKNIIKIYNEVIKKNRK